MARIDAQRGPSLVSHKSPRARRGVGGAPPHTNGQLCTGSSGVGVNGDSASTGSISPDSSLRAHTAGLSLAPSSVRETPLQMSTMASGFGFGFVSDFKSSASQAVARMGRADAPQSPSQSMSHQGVVSLSSASSVPAKRYQKKDPLFYKEHQAMTRAATRRKVSTLMESLKSKARKVLKAPSIDGMLAKRLAIARQVADPTSDEDIKIRHLREILKRNEGKLQASLRPPRRKLKEQQRIAYEEKLLKRRALGILGRKPLPAALEPEQEELVSSTFRRQGKVAAIPGAGVQSHDVQKLRAGQWLNDEVINFYMKLIEKRGNEAAAKRAEAREAKQRLEVNAYDQEASGEERTEGWRMADIALVKDAKKRWNSIWNVHVFTSYFYEKLSKGGYAGVRQWTRKVDIFTKDRVLLPINMGNAHWVCAVINMRDCRFEYYDSMCMDNPKVFAVLEDYLANEYADKKKDAFGPLDLRGWLRYTSHQSPQQANGFDCGVFATMTVEQLSRRHPHDGDLHDELTAEAVVKRSHALAAATIDEDAVDVVGEDEEWNFSQDNMPYLRRRMVYEIATTQLLDV